MLQAKIVLLHIAKFIGLFHFSRRKTAAGIHILCYHGFSYKDEHQFRPKLFITETDFKQRLAKIAEMGFNVISLDQAVKNIEASNEVLNSLVITIDDGWQSTEDIAQPLLAAHGFPWTLYLTTYYAEKQTPIMSVALQYLCWKTTMTEINFSLVNNRESGNMPLATKSQQDKAAARLSELGNALPTAQERQDFVRKIAFLLKLDTRELEDKRMFNVVSFDSVKKMAAAGVDIQLHTHRHTLHGVNREALNAEIRDNRNFIYKAIGNTPGHFCYPGGFYNKAHHKWLLENGVESATTCKPGLNYSNTPLLELNRFLDGANISTIEFEAELSGFLELARLARAKLGGLKKTFHHQANRIVKFY